MDRPAVGRGILALALLLAGAPVAAASVGVGVGRVPLTVPSSAVAGRTYRLRPDFHVVNTGDRTATYRFRVQRLSAQDGKTLPAGWVSLAVTSRRLPPGGGANVAVTVHLPRGAGDGTYVSDVVASTSGAEAGAGPVTVGAAAVTPIHLAVGGRSRSAVQRPWSSGILTFGAAAAAVLLLAAAWRALGLRLVLERRGSHSRNR